MSRRTCDLCRRRVWFWQRAMWVGPNRRRRSRWLEHLACYHSETLMNVGEK